MSKRFLTFFAESFSFGKIMESRFNLMIKYVFLILFCCCIQGKAFATDQGSGSLFWQLNAHKQDAKFAPRKRTRYSEIIDKSKVLFVYQLALIYGLTKVPTNWTKWDKDHIAIRHWGSNWSKNLRSTPVWDRDPLWVNYAGHPIGGAGYYTMARQSGLNQRESFVYTFIQSTFVWEYGVEALVEEPSIQDLLVTPTVGSVLGEIEYRAINQIDANDGKVWGSTAWGSFFKGVLSPFNLLVTWTQSWFSSDTTKANVYTGFSYRDDSKYTPSYGSYNHGKTFLLSLRTEF